MSRWQEASDAAHAELERALRIYGWLRSKGLPSSGVWAMARSYQKAVKRLNALRF